MKKLVIAIDGPAGSGKSTIAKILSQNFGLYYLDTGAMYRAVAYKVLKDKLDIYNEETVEKLVNDLDLRINFDGMNQKTIINGDDVTNKIRTEEVSFVASGVSSIPRIRVKLVEIQRDFAAKNGGIIDGRDIGTYVLPFADYKFFLTAKIEERAKRRYLENIARDPNADFEDIKSKMEERDQRDMNRDFAPLKRADDAIEIDTTGLGIVDVTKKILSYFK